MTAMLKLIKNIGRSSPMKLINVIIFYLLGCFLFVQAQYQIPVSVFGNGGAVLSDTSCNITGTVGQTLCGEMFSSNYVKNVGFWYLVQYHSTNSVEETQAQLPKVYHLHQNYPNPFNPVCMIEYAVPELSEVTIIVYDIMGREAVELFRGDDAPGFHQVLFQPEQLSSGLYFYRMTAKSLKTGKNYSEVKKALYVK
jgi:hypothetical protein